jgi:hypothetical protein
MSGFQTVPVGQATSVIDDGYVAPLSAPGSDPFFASVVMLLGFEGADGSTTITDESSKKHGNATVNGNAKISRTQAKFGVSSLSLDGTGDWISFADSADWQLSAANSDQFTIEFWLFTSTAGSNTPVLGQSTSTSNTAWYILWDHNRVEFLTTSTGIPAGGTTIAAPISTLASSAWGHVAIDKDASGKIRVYENGVMQASSTPANSAMFNSTGPLETRNLSATTSLFNGFIDELRITKGVARYQSDIGFALPTAPYPRS